MGANTSNQHKIELVFRDGMTAQVTNKVVNANITIDELSKFYHGEYSRVGIMSCQNRRQNKDWLWITDRNKTLDFYIKESQINVKDAITVCFFV
jgi:hypothetical protein